jgi:hypothetical protein
MRRLWLAMTDEFTRPNFSYNPAIAHHIFTLKINGDS